MRFEERDTRSRSLLSSPSKGARGGSGCSQWERGGAGAVRRRCRQVAQLGAPSAGRDEPEPLPRLSRASRVSRAAGALGVSRPIPTASCPVPTPAKCALGLSSECGCSFHPSGFVCTGHSLLLSVQLVQQKSFIKSPYLLLFSKYKALSIY